MVMPNPAMEARSAADTGQEGLRRPTVVPAPVAADPEVSERPRRRTFTAQEKRRIIKEADQAAGIGAIGAILRRHGLYSSALSEWRRQRDAGVLGALTPAKRGPKPAEANPLTAELAEALRENSQLKRRLERAEGIIAVQKNLPICLGFRWRRPSPTACPDSDLGGRHANQRCRVRHLCRPRSLPRQPGPKPSAPEPGAGAVSAKPEAGAIGRIATKRARSSPLAPLR